jgi:uncharacterized protein YxjI
MSANTTVYTIHRQLWAWGDSYLIADADTEEQLYKITSTTFAWRKEFWLKDMNDNIILRAEGQGNWFSFSYNIFDGRDKKQGELTQNSVWSTRFYTLALDAGDTYDITGNFSKSEYEFSDGQETVADCERPFWALTRKYTLNISADLPASVHQYLILSVAAMDIILQAQSAS